MEKLFEGNIRKKFFFFCLPLIFSTIMSQSNVIIDSIMVGRFIGDHALAAASATSDFQTLIQGLFWGYSGGATVYVAMLFGKGDYNKMANVIKVNILISSVIAILVSIGLIMAYKPMFEVLRIPQEIYNETLEYYNGSLMMLVLVNINCFFVYIYNAINKNRIAFILSFVSCALNISSKYIFIKICNLGILGAVMGGAMSSLLATVVYIIYFIKILKQLDLKVSYIYLNMNELKQSASLGFPNMLQQSIMYLCTTLISPLKNSCGAFALSGMSVGMKVYNINAQIYQNSNKVLSNYIAQCVGAGKLKKINPGIKAGMMQTAIFLMPVLVLQARTLLMSGTVPFRATLVSSTAGT